jgi:1-acyl-sn-glycerol-3-phosphate acyltransferase
MPNAECVVKREAWSNPFLGGIVRAANYIPNDGGETLIGTCVARLREGGKLLLFPEGTRSPKGELRVFKRGAARIALQAGCPVVLVDIDCRPPFLGKGDPWYQAPVRLPCYTVTVHEPAEFCTQGAGGASEALEARRVSALWREGFRERLGHG